MESGYWLLIWRYCLIAGVGDFMVGNNLTESSRVVKWHRHKGGWGLGVRRCALPRSGKERNHIEAQCLRVAEHDVHVLDGLARGPFDQVVDGRHDDQPVS